MLNKDALEDLLRAFHADREQASHHYQALRERLIRFFQWNRTEMPEELADEVIDRLARRFAKNKATEPDILPEHELA